MNVLACGPGVDGSSSSWLPFTDPETSPVEESNVLKKFQQTVSQYQEQLQLVSFEASETTLRWYLKRSVYNLDVATKSWLEWIYWRRDTKCDEIAAGDIEEETRSGLALWRGRDKLGRPCLLITGRMLDAERCRIKGFQKFMIKTLEDGLKELDAENERIRAAQAHEMDSGEKISRDLAPSKISDNHDVTEQFCVLYDRRGLDYKNISPTLYAATRTLIDRLRVHYGPRMGTLYVLHSNWLYWSVYHLVINPLLSLLYSDTKVVVVESPRDLLRYFDDDQILLLSPAVSAFNGGNEITNSNNPLATTSTQRQEAFLIPDERTLEELKRG